VPLVEVTLYDRRVDEATSKKLIEKLTDVVCECTTEELRPEVWVVVKGLPASQWGIGGKPGS
jgi:phenylpyruvate tautomerase PptA (4-oxalocrotonate tautomerase family)